jgi:trans-aconitate methyltransferase
MDSSATIERIVAMSRVLAIGGPTALELAKQSYPDDDIVEGEIWPKARKNSFDAIVSYHVLQLVKNREIIDYLKRYYAILKPEGNLALFVPSLEWLCEEILFNEQPSQMVKPHLWGNQTTARDTHQSCHTMRTLRRDLSLANFGVVNARAGLYTSQYTGPDGKPVVLDAGQHVVLAYAKELQSVPLAE